MSKDRAIGYESDQNEEEKKLGMRTTNLLVIGINKYSNGIPTLNNAVRDAKRFKEVMESKYGTNKSIQLYDEQATLEGLINAFDQLQKELTKEDNLIIYFSGHGELVHNKGYWIPADAVSGKRHTYLSNHYIKDLLKDVKAHHVLAIVDACFSGALLVNQRSTTMSRYYAMPSRWVMTSGQVKPVPDGAPGEHSPFAKSLLTQLEYNPKPFLSLSELWVNMREGVAANSNQTPACEPVRDADHQGGEYYFIDKNADGLPPIPAPSKSTVVERKIEKDPVVIPPKEEVPKLTGFAGLKQELEAHLIASDTKLALELLLKKLDPDSSNKNTVILLLSRANGLERDINAGIIGSENSRMQKARIDNALNSLINDLSEEDLPK